MKKFNFLKLFVSMTLAFAATAFTGCVDDNEDTELPYLEVTPEVLTFDEAGLPTGEGDGKFIVKSNRPWTLTVETADQEWVRPSVTEGNGNGEVTFNLPETREGRTATLTFSLSNTYTVYKEQKVTIQQGNVITPELVYKETFGTAGGSATPYPTVTDYTGWDKSGDGSANVTYEGQNAQLRNSSPSNNQYSGYEGSGGTNLYFSATPNDFIVKEISLPEDVLSYSLTFGAYIYNPTSADPYYTTYEVALSADGEKWTDPVPFEMTFVADKSWNLATSKFKFDKYYEKLYIKFSAVSGNNRIDDVTLSTGNGGTEVNLETGAVDAELKVTTEKPVGISATGATLKGSVSATASVTEVGFQYTENAENIDWTGVAKTAADEVAASFSKEITGLTEGKVYAVRAYATSDEGDVYGEVLTFTAENIELGLSCAGVMAYIKGLEVASGSQAELTDYVGKSFDAYIAANNEGGNLSSMLVVVDNTGEPASGLLFYGSKYNTTADYPVGAKITITVTEKSIVKNYNGVLEVMDVEESVDKNTTVTMKVPEISASELNTGDYCYMYVKIKELTYKGEVGDKWYSGTSGGHNRYFENSGEEVTVRTSKNAAYKDAAITSAGPAALSGVPQHNFYQDKTTIQVYPTSAADVAAFSAGATEPTVTTGSASALTATGATLAGSSQNVDNATEVGVKYAEYAESIDWSKSGTKVAAKEVAASWEVTVSGLSAGVKYAYVAYAVTPSGTLYGETKSFETQGGEAADITTDFMVESTYPAGFPASSSEKKTAAEAFDFGGHTYTLCGSSSGGYYRGKIYKGTDYYLMLGKSNAYIELPSVAGKSLSKVKCTVPGAASGNVSVGVADAAGSFVSGGEAIQWTRENESDTRYYTYTLSGTAQDTKYRLLITNEYNAQFMKIELWYTDGGSAAQPSLTVDPTSLSFTADGDNTGKTISCTVANQGTLKLFAKSSDAQQFPVTVSGTSVVVKALANETTSEKNATVTIYLADSENGAQMASKTVSVTQAAKSGGSGDGSTIVVDFSSADVTSPSLPTSKTTSTDTYTIDGLTYVISASGAGSYYWIDGSNWGNPEPNKGLYLKEGYIELPAVAGKGLTAVTATSTSGMGGGVKLSITDTNGSDVVSMEDFTKGTPLTLALDGAANTAYRLVVAAGNAQIAKLELVYGDGGGSVPATPTITAVNPSKVDFTADGGSTTINVTVSNQGDNALSATGLSGLFAASVSGNNVTVTAQPNTGAAVSQTLTIAVANGNSVTVPVTMAAKSGGSEPGAGPAAGTVLWAEDWASFGDGGTAFANNPLISEYDYAGQTLYNPESESYTVTYTANDDVRASSGTSTNMTEGHLWFNKSAAGEFTTSAIKLYGATKLVLSHAQATSGSLLEASYSIDGSEWTSLGSQSGPIAQKDYSFEVPAGTDAVMIRFSHPDSNAKNTRADNFKLVVGE
ncbi:DUF5689 domain-containing protein [uncultured Alistipes sp.]|uniref:DUF5689 domain-containing protein n=1 Tax=uncultured Alistipes sp. TaxID=538949 RepID=UPI0028060073|nr:DUF5689 domain-containing protein [uncultured Alistipes sp.]